MMKTGFIACATVTIICIAISIGIFYDLMTNRINRHMKFCTILAIFLSSYLALSTATIVECLSYGEWSWLRFSLLASSVFGSILIISAFINTCRTRWIYIREERYKKLWWR